MVKDVRFTHRMFTQEEIITDINEREMISGRELLIASEELIKNKYVTLHFDNLNAAVIYGKGSTKLAQIFLENWNISFGS